MFAQPPSTFWQEAACSLAEPSPGFTATDLDVEYKGQKYFFDKTIYDRRVYNGVGKADPSVEIKFGPNIKDWPEMIALTDNLLLKVASVINDPVTTTDELIPSGETSSYRSNPLGLAEFTLSRKDPEYVGRAKAIQAVEKKREELGCFCKADEYMKPMMKEIKAKFADREITGSNTGYGSTIFAVKPGDGSAREQAASCQKVLGGWANIAKEYATSRSVAAVRYPLFAAVAAIERASISATDEI